MVVALMQKWQWCILGYQKSGTSEAEERKEKPTGS